MEVVRFNVVVDFQAPAQVVWDELVDWKGHEARIPATRVDLDGDDPTAIGCTFTAWTGVGKFALEDRMRVVECDWTADSESGRCQVEKLGPILRGHAGFTVIPISGGARVDWNENVTMARLPRLLVPVAVLIGSAGFRLGMWRLNRLLSKRRTGPDLASADDQPAQ